MYEYRGRIVRVIDGDTVEAELDLGFHVGVRQTLRLAGLNAPEMKGDERPRGLAAREYLARLIAEQTEGTHALTVRTDRDATGKYGRYLATLVAGDTDLNTALIAAGHAVPAVY